MTRPSIGALIPVGAVGTAEKGDVLQGKTFSSRVEGTNAAGLMPNIGRQVSTITTQNGQAVIKKGYHDGTGTVTAQLIGFKSEIIKEGSTIAGVNGTFKGQPTLTLASPNIGNGFETGSHVVEDVRFSPNGTLIGVCQSKSYDGRIFNFYKKVGSGYAKVHTVASCPNDSTSASICLDWLSNTECLIVYQRHIYKVTFTASGEYSSISLAYSASFVLGSLKVSPKRKYITIYDYSNRDIKIFDNNFNLLNTGTLGTYCWLEDIIWSSDGVYAFIVAASGDYPDLLKVFVYDSANNNFRSTVNGYAHSGAAALAVLPMPVDGTYYIYIFTNKNIFLFGFKNGVISKIHEVASDIVLGFVNSYEWDAEASPNGRYIAVTGRGRDGNNTHLLEIINPQTISFRKVLAPFPTSYGTSLTWDMLGDRLALGTKSGGVYAYNLSHFSQ